MDAIPHHLRQGLPAAALLLAACAAPAPLQGRGDAAPPPGPACACASLEGELAPAAAPGAARLLSHAEAGLTRALARRGCPAARRATAPWRLRYELHVDEREQVLEEGAAHLEPRLVCDGAGCRIRHDWIHQGPPGRPPPRRVTRDAELRLQLHEGDSPVPAWQGSAARTLPASGARAADTVAAAARDLATLLPRLQQRANCAPP